MKTRSFITALLLLLAATALGQERPADRSGDFGERLAARIEEFIESITGELEGRGPSERRNEDPADDTTLSRRQDLKTVTFDGTTTIEADRVLTSNVVVKGGDLVVYGTIDGDVLVVGGTLYVKDGAVIGGNARIINGEVVREDGGTIAGYIDRTTSGAARHREERSQYRRSSYRLNARWVEEITNLDNFIFRYNRVEGVFLGLGSEKKYYWDGHRQYNTYGSVGWGFKSHTWRGNFGLSRQFAVSRGNGGTSHLFELGAEGHSLTDTKDDWIIRVHENSAAAFLIHEDFRDYFQRNGFSGHVAWYTQGEELTTQLKVEYRADTYASLEKRADWALFGGKKVFRDNPPIDDGSMRSVFGSAGLTTVSKTAYGPEGWSVYASGELARSRFGGDFSFRRVVADVRRFQPLGMYDNLNVRIRVGSSGGILPVQKTFDLGGLGTLNARRFKSETGNRMILGNAEYIINGDFLHDLDFWPSFLLRHFNFIFLADAGWIDTALPSTDWMEGFEKVRLSDFRSDLGVGISNRSGSFRAAVVWRTDVSAPARFIFRFDRPF